VGGPKVHKVSGGRAQGSQAASRQACDVLRFLIMGIYGTRFLERIKIKWKKKKEK